MTALETIRAAFAKAEAGGRLRPRDVDAVRGAVDALAREGVPLDHPADLFGPWSELSEPLRAALRKAVEGEIRRAMDWHPRGMLWPATARMLRAVRAPLLGVDATRADLWSARVWHAPGRLSARIYAKAARRAFANGAPIGPEEVLAAVGRPASWLLGDFVEGVREDPRARGFFHETATGSSWGFVIGIDLIPTPDGVVCVEANLNTAFNDERREQVAPEPSVQALFDLARRMDVRGVWWDDMDLSPSPDWLLWELSEGARRLGLTLTVREDARLRRDAPVPAGLPVPGRRLFSVVDPPPGTLAVRRNQLNVGTDLLLSDKGLFTRATSAELARTGDRRVQVLPMTRVPEVHPAAADGIPNLVYKYPDSGKGVGVFFLKARDTEHALSIARELDRAHGEPPGLFQEFRCPRLLSGRRVYDVRIELIVTPLGVVTGFARRRESSRPLPDTLPEGVVEARGVFTSNLATGGRFAPVDPGEEAELEQAALAIGEALARVFERTFVTRG